MNLEEFCTKVINGSLQKATDSRSGLASLLRRCYKKRSQTWALRKNVVSSALLCERACRSSSQDTVFLSFNTTYLEGRREKDQHCQVRHGHPRESGEGV